MRSLFFNLMVRFPILAWLLAASGVVMLLVGIVQLRSFRHIQTDGILTQGTVTNFAPNADKAVDMDYTYEAGGKKYTGYSEIGVRDQPGLHPGAAIEVRYLKEDPAQSVTGKSWPSKPYMFLFCGVLFQIVPWAVRKKRRPM